MKLLNQSLTYLTVSILVIVSLWAVIFYVNMIDEIHDSIDDGLDNTRLLIIQKAKIDSTLLLQNELDERNYIIKEINRVHALSIKDNYTDTLLYMLNEEDLEPARMLITAFENQGRYYELRVTSTMAEEDDLIEELLWAVSWLYFILVVSIFVINNLVLRKLWKPFYNLLHQLKTFQLGKSETLPSIETKTREFNDLQVGLKALLTKSLEIFEQQKEFIGNASHELQTPLAIATNKLELLLEQENVEAAQVKSVTEVLQIIERLVRLNKSLLLLTKIENKQFLDNQQVSMNGLCAESLSDSADFAEFKNIEITTSNMADLNVEMDVSLANIIVSNLLKNALTHNVQNGKINIEISNDSIKFCNTGKSQSLDSEKIFDRFYKSEQTGTGLGLSILKAICDLYGFRIWYTFEKSMHCFEVKFHR